MKTNCLRIWLLLPDPYTQSMPARAAITEIYGNFLPKLGHKIVWITPGCEESKFHYNDISVIALPYGQSTFLPKRFINLFHSLYKKYKIIKLGITTDGIDVIQVRNNIYDALLAVYIKQKFNIPFVFQYSFPQLILKKEQASTFFEVLFNKVEYHILEYIFNQSDLILPISDWMEDELILAGLKKTKLMVFPLGANIESFSPNNDGSKIKNMYSLYSYKIIAYIGSLDKLRQLSIIILAFRKVQLKHSRTKLLIVGEGNDKNDLEKLSIELGLQESIIFLGNVSYFDIPFFISASDICLSPIPPTSIYKISSPTKLFEYMASGKPIIANQEILEHKYVLESSNGGILVNYDANQFAESIIDLIEDPQRAARLGNNGRIWVEKNRSYEAMACLLEARYYTLIRTNKI